MKKTGRIWKFTIGIICVSFICFCAPITQSYAEDNEEREQYVPGEILVQYQENVSEIEIQSNIEDNRGEMTDICTPAKDGAVVVVDIPEDQTVEEAVQEYEKEGNVIAASPNYIMELYETPNDPNVSTQTYLSQIAAEGAWDFVNAVPHEKTLVAVLDTGADITHPDLQSVINTDLCGEILSSYGDVGPLLGDDYMLGRPSYGNSHGSHVSGIIAAMANNGEGIAGVGSALDNSAIELMVVDIFSDKDAQGGDTTSMGFLIKGMEYAQQQGAEIINLSLGVEKERVSNDSILKNECKKLHDAGISIVCAAGNDSSYDGGTITTIPSDYDSTISVIAVDGTGNKLSFSNYGYLKDLSAPGNDIYSTLSVANGSYGWKSGTSLSTPEVTAAAALMKSVNESLSPDEIKKSLINTATDVGTFGKDVYTGAGVLNVQKATAAAYEGALDVTYQLVSADERTGTFTVQLQVGQGFDEYITNVRIPVWSAKDQNNLVWYTPEKQADGSYIVNVDISKHKSQVGLYYADCYVTDILGRQKCVGSVTCDMSVKADEIFVTAEDDSTVNYKAVISGLVSPFEEKAVRVAVWSKEGGQDDLAWITGVKSAEGEYKANIDLQKFKHLGTYYVDAYVQLQNGSECYIGGTIFETGKPTVSVSVASINVEEGIFSVKITPIDHAKQISSILLPVWSTRDQSNLVWYQGAKQTDGSYIVNVNLSKHQYQAGLYYADCYLNTVTGSRIYAGGTTCEMNAVKGKVKIELNDDKTTYKVQLNGAIIPAGAKDIQFAVWSRTGGQDDLTWFTGIRQSDGNYMIDISVNKFRHLGVFYVDIYGQTKAGSVFYLTGSTFEVNGPRIKTLEIANVNRQNGTFDVIASGIENVFALRSVRIPVWCASDQNDLKWYDAIRQADGSYKATVSLSNHKYHLGNYYVDCYSVDISSSSKYEAGIRQNCSINGGEMRVSNLDAQQKVFTGELLGLDVPGGQAGVRVAVWSAVNGQDDLIWYQALPFAMGYKVNIPISNHQSKGKYYVDTYVILKNANWSYANSTTFYVNN